MLFLVAGWRFAVGRVSIDAKPSQIFPSVLARNEVQLSSRRRLRDQRVAVELAKGLHPGWPIDFQSLSTALAALTSCFIAIAQNTENTLAVSGIQHSLIIAVVRAELSAPSRAMRLSRSNPP
ncbi:MAG: hypothetical protein KA154_10745 [Gemmatimonadaceae bacterium]|nr:hypothetical protein [Gemmatimonadaceae bacterium]MCC6433322.1 hypothetical protein [Gemmatimonadaceae bacterium]